MEKRILITGGAGYIGSSLVTMLLESSYRVNILDLFLRGRVPWPVGYKQPYLNIYKGDVSDESIVQKSLENVSTIIYLAGVSDGRAGRKNPVYTNKVNFDDFKKLVKLAKSAGCERIVFASTFGVYGNSYTVPLTENLKQYPAEPYSASKLAAEKYLLGQGAPGFCVTCLRIAMVFGSSPQMRDDFIVNRMTKDALLKRTIRVMGGGQKRPQIHIKDLSRLFIKMVEIKADKISGKVFNAGTINPSIGEIAQEIKRQLSFPIKIEMLPAIENENSFELDSSRLISETGFVPRFTLKDGIVEMIHHWNDVIPCVANMGTSA